MRKQTLLSYKSSNGEKIRLVFGRYPVINPDRKYSKHPALILYVDDIKAEFIELDEVPESLLNQLKTLQKNRASSETLQEVLAEIEELHSAPNSPSLPKNSESNPSTPEERERFKFNGRTSAWDYLESLGLKPSRNLSPRIKALIARQAKQAGIRAKKRRKHDDGESSSSLVLA